jgi:hypothetical protein
VLTLAGASRVTEESTRRFDPRRSTPAGTNSTVSASLQKWRLRGRPALSTLTVRALGRCVAAGRRAEVAGSGRVGSGCGWRWCLPAVGRLACAELFENGDVVEVLAAFRCGAVALHGSRDPDQRSRFGRLQKSRAHSTSIATLLSWFSGARQITDRWSPRQLGSFRSRSAGNGRRLLVVAHLRTPLCGRQDDRSAIRTQRCVKVRHTRTERSPCSSYTGSCRCESRTRGSVAPRCCALFARYTAVTSSLWTALRPETLGRSAPLPPAEPHPAVDGIT